MVLMHYNWRSGACKSYRVVESNAKDGQHQTNCDEDEIGSDRIKSMSLLVVGHVRPDMRLLIRCNRHIELLSPFRWKGRLLHDRASRCGEDII